MTKLGLDSLRLAPSNLNVKQCANSLEEYRGGLGPQGCCGGFEPRHTAQCLCDGGAGGIPQQLEGQGGTVPACGVGGRQCFFLSHFLCKTAYFPPILWPEDLLIKGVFLQESGSGGSAGGREK